MFETLKERMQVRALERIYRRAKELDAIDVNGARMILVSDMHKGGRDATDDFLRCERIYNAVLTYYSMLGYALAVLGDAEELWKNSLDEILPRDRDGQPLRDERGELAGYWHTLKLEAAFHRTGADKYIRLWGNHDDLWRSKRQVRKHLGPAFRDSPEPLELCRAVRIPLEETGERVGELFLTHGSQGTWDSDYLRPISHLLLRLVYRPAQRLIGISTMTPAIDWKLRGEIEKAMFRWTLSKEPAERPVLIAGHTHRPVFAEAKPVMDIPVEQSDNFAFQAALKEFARAEKRRTATLPPPLEVDPPSYFNVGSCAYPDGDITLIEIADGRISLVRWGPEFAHFAANPGDPDDRPATGLDREVLERMNLRDVLRAVRSSAG